MKILDNYMAEVKLLQASIKCFTPESLSFFSQTIKFDSSIGKIIFKFLQ